MTQNMMGNSMSEIKRFISSESNGTTNVAKYWKNSELCDYDFVEIK